MAEATLRRPKKLITCCDGTWMNSDKGADRGFFSSDTIHVQTPSNVTRIGRAILPEDSTQRPQIVYYQSGVGSGSTYVERIVGGGTGEGIGEHIREAYSFLANNYANGDSIFLLGFSRGAFTARSIGGLIGGMGLLTKKGLPWFYLIFKDWENAGVPDYVPKISSVIPDFNITAPATDIQGYLNNYRQELLKRKLSQEVEIQAIGVWDTVGALGIPTPYWLQKLGLPDFLHEYKFLDTKITPNVKHAFHALALDEQRSSYSPTIWELPKDATTHMKQVWFPGVHSNVGGSYDDTGIADITLAWMMSQLSPWIEFYPDYIREQHRLNQQSSNKGHRGWALGKLYDSCKFPTNISGRRHRTPKLYHRMDYVADRETDQLLTHTNELVHPSVRIRMRLNGKSYEDKGLYSPQALQDWRLEDRRTYTDEGPRRSVEVVKDSVQWTYCGSDPQGHGKVMSEEGLGPFEMDLLEMDPRATAEVLGGDQV